MSRIENYRRFTCARQDLRAPCGLRFHSGVRPNQPIVWMGAFSKHCENTVVRYQISKTRYAKDALPVGPPRSARRGHVPDRPTHYMQPLHWRSKATSHTPSHAMTTLVRCGLDKHRRMETAAFADHITGCDRYVQPGAR
jgi:hypothetical protein